MLEYIRVNKNPKNRRTGDCSTRALCNILNISYDEALKEQFEAAKKYRYGLTDKELIDKIMEKYGWTKIKQPKKANGKKYQVRELDELLNPGEDALVIIAHHWTCIKGNRFIEDIWNCGYKTVRNYWRKL